MLSYQGAERAPCECVAGRAGEAMTPFAPFPQPGAVVGAERREMRSISALMRTFPPYPF